MAVPFFTANSEICGQLDQTRGLLCFVLSFRQAVFDSIVKLTAGVALVACIANTEGISSLRCIHPFSPARRRALLVSLMWAAVHRERLAEQTGSPDWGLGTVPHSRRMIAMTHPFWRRWETVDFT
jgi:hypothetical protein